MAPNSTQLHTVLVVARVYRRLKVVWDGHETHAAVQPLALCLLVSCMIL